VGAGDRGTVSAEEGSWVTRRLFRDRVDAGDQLADALRDLADESPVVVGLPRGGVPVAARVAAALDAPLDVIIVRKLGVPFQPELAMGAIGEDAVRVVNDNVVRAIGIDEHELDRAVEHQQQEIERRSQLYRQGRVRESLEGRTVIIVDDGLATGATARAACLIARAHGAKRVVLAVPVAPRKTVRKFADVADEVVCLAAPEGFYAVGEFYRQFPQTPDDEVVALLRQAATRADHTASSATDDDPPLRDEDVMIPVDGLTLGGHLMIPEHAKGLVLFAHGSGSSRHSPRNRYVAEALHSLGLGTLLFDLLTHDEETDRRHVFDVAMLADRLAKATVWLRSLPDARGLRIGYFGASTGAAAAIDAAARPRADVAAVVSRGGRPDLADGALGKLRAPTLLVVGGRDAEVLGLNEWALSRLHCERRLAVVPGATHLFEEPGALEDVARLAGDWFIAHLPPVASARL
jgi:putative phosphoribosyl transferase